MYQVSHLHGQMSKKLGLPQNHVKRNNVSGQTQQQACHYHLAKAVITASQWKKWSLAGALPGDAVILSFPFFFFKIFIFSSSSDSISRNPAMPCCLPDREVRDGGWCLWRGRCRGLRRKIHNHPLSASGCRNCITYRINTH